MPRFHILVTEEPDPAHFSDTETASITTISLPSVEVLSLRVPTLDLTALTALVLKRPRAPRADKGRPRETK